eukprot:15461139-Alexandrium_andersonii.AAC.1
MLRLEVRPLRRGRFQIHRTISPDSWPVTLLLLQQGPGADLERTRPEVLTGTVERAYGKAMLVTNLEALTHREAQSRTHVEEEGDWPLGLPLLGEVIGNLGKLLRPAAFRGSRVPLFTHVGIRLPSHLPQLRLE